MARYDPGLAGARSLGHPPRAYGVQYIRGFEFDAPNIGLSADDIEERRKRAMIMSAVDRAKRPVCPVCKIHKVGRVGKGLNAPLDNQCGICSRISALHGPRRAAVFHIDYCSFCQRKDD